MSPRVKLTEEFRVNAPDGAELFLHRIRGSGQRRHPVILTHGTFSDGRACGLLASYLARSGFDCWVLDLRGHGQSSSGHSQPDFESFGRLDVPTALEKVTARTQREQVFWVAHSGGGLALLMHLARHPEAQSLVRGAVLIASQATGAGATAWTRARLALAALGTNLLGRTPGKLLKLGTQDEGAPVMNEWFRWNLQRRWLGPDRFDYLAALGKLRVPALCLAGAGDHFIAPYGGCKTLFEALGSADKRLLLCGKDQGFAQDYDHARILVSKQARQDVWPRVAEWLVERDPLDVASFLPSSERAIS